ncbi:MAG: glycosyltransferase family 39 protein [Planctomycetaceae bacterium]|nr:glycosyltransferase family 39 protein [Planctomycetaceae bacterium]
MNRDGSQGPYPGPLGKRTPLEKLYDWWNRKDDPTIHFFLGLLLVHVLLWTLLPMVLHHNPSKETLQLLTLGRQWAWGYHQQAPLPAWLAIASCTLTGTAVWPTYLLGSISGAVCIYCAWILGREFLKPWTAVCAAISMEACLYFNYTVPVLSSEMIGRTFWALAVLAFFAAIRSGRRTHWVQTAICLGFGLLCRYDTALLIGAMLLFTFWNERARKCWDTSRPFLAAAITFGIVFFHGWWVMDHIKGADLSFTDYLLASEQSAEATTHPLVEALALLPVLIVLSPLVNWLSPTEENVDDERELVRQYLVWVSFMPPAIMAALALVNGLRIDSLWMSPLWIYGGVLFVLWSRLEETRFAWRRTLVWTGTACGIIGGTAFATYALFPPSLEDGCEVHYPGAQLAQLVRNTWDNSYPGYELKVVGGDWWHAGNASWFNSQHPYVYANLDTNESPFMRDDKFQQTGGVIVLDGAVENAALESRIAQISPFATVLEPMQLNWQHTAVNTEPVTVKLVMVPPAQVAKEIEAARALLQLETPTAATSTIPEGQTLFFPTQPSPQRDVVEDEEFSPTAFFPPAAQPAQENAVFQPPRQHPGLTQPQQAVAPQPQTTPNSAPTQITERPQDNSGDVIPSFMFKPRN